ncbi:type IV toxin-antitoxin system AbiEi family antitoxin domain-containing protein [Parvularcula maris]|uniref:Transcriptional regulator n=1 Tax=Parvularcula maris TaxID=2965077 RepID=A0A9X2RIW9_9PROT|nr:hypothetical protein [Parvularcula maris]MCQ8186509.1 hypothetical protein [Parvularcula maris]
MSTLAEIIRTARQADRLLTEGSLRSLLGGSDSRRYGLVNRALKDGSLIRIKRGLYTLSPDYRTSPPHPFAVAQGIVPGSYVSLETALAHYGWIPEAVFETASIAPGRKSSEWDHETMGRFGFYPLALQPYGFLRQVDRVEIGGQTALLARPHRALMDLVARRKLPWQGLEWLVESLRIELQHLGNIRLKDLDALKTVYKQKLPNLFLRELRTAVADLKGTKR